MWYQHGEPAGKTTAGLCAGSLVPSMVLGMVPAPSTLSLNLRSSVLPSPGNKTSGQLGQRRDMESSMLFQDLQPPPNLGPLPLFQRQNATCLCTLWTLGGVDWFASRLSGLLAAEPAFLDLQRQFQSPISCSCCHLFASLCLCGFRPLKTLCCRLCWASVCYVVFDRSSPHFHF